MAGQFQIGAGDAGPGAAARQVDLVAQADTIAVLEQRAAAHQPRHGDIHVEIIGADIGCQDRVTAQRDARAGPCRDVGHPHVGPVLLRHADRLGEGQGGKPAVAAITQDTAEGEGGVVDIRLEGQLAMTAGLGRATEGERHEGIEIDVDADIDMPLHLADAGEQVEEGKQPDIRLEFGVAGPAFHLRRGDEGHL